MIDAISWAALLSTCFFKLGFASELLSYPHNAGKQLCRTATFFGMRHPGVKIVDIQANDVRGFNISTIQNGDIPKADFFGLDFCNVTVTYVRESQKIPIELTVWLPRKEKWNGRFQGTGGSGFVTGYGPLTRGGHNQSSNQVT